MLEWEVTYVVQKVAPVVTRWTVTKGPVPRPLQPVSAVKRCVRQGVVCLSMQWRVTCGPSLPPDTPQHITTDEPLELLRSSLPLVVQQFEELTLAAKKGKKKSRTKKVTESHKDKENICTNTEAITDYFEPVQSSSAQGNKVTAIPTSDSKVIGATKVEQKQIPHVHKSPKKHTSKGVPLDKKDWRGGKNWGMESEDDDDDDDSECDERELSLIIDRMINMKVSVGNQQQGAALHVKQRMEEKKYDASQRPPSVKDVNYTNTHQKRKEKDKTHYHGVDDINEENVSTPNHPSLFDRASKRLVEINSEPSKPSLGNHDVVEIDLCLDGSIDDDDENALSATSPGNTLDASCTSVNEVDVERESKTLETHKAQTQTPRLPNTQKKAETQCHDGSTDMFDDTLSEDTSNVAFEEALSEGTLAVMLEGSLTLEDSVPDVNVSQEVGGNGKCSSLEGNDLDLPLAVSRSPVHGVTSPSQQVCQSLIQSFSNNCDKPGNYDDKLDRVLRKTMTGKLPSDQVKLENTQTEDHINLPSVFSPVKVSVEKEFKGSWSLESLGYNEESMKSHNTAREQSKKRSSHKETRRPAATFSPVKASVEEELLDAWPLEIPRSTDEPVKSSNTTRQCSNIYSSREETQQAAVTFSPVKATVEEELGACSLESPRCTREPIKASTTARQRSEKHTSREETQKAASTFQGVPGYNVDVFGLGRSCQESSPATSSITKAAITGDRGVEAPVASQQGYQTNACERNKTNTVIQYDLDTEGDVSKKDNLSFKGTKEMSSLVQHEPDSQEFDSFSPADLTLTLAQRLRLKNSDKKFRKLLDNLR